MSTMNPQLDHDDQSESRSLRSIKFDKWPPDSYFEEEYKLLNDNLSYKGSLYDKAMKLEIKGAYELEKLEPKAQLIRIEEAIKINIKIDGLTAFKYGRLFLFAKRACRMEGIGFKQWVHVKFGISYETANNYMNVYMNCLNMMSIAVKLPLSILVKIGKPSFPEELRDFLFEQGNITSMTNIDLENLVQKYKEGGFEEIRTNIETWNNEYYMYRQTQYIMDRCKGILIDMQNTYDKTSDKYKYYKSENGKQEQGELLPESDDVHKRMLVGLQSAKMILTKTIEKSEHILFHLNCDNEHRLKM